MANSIVSGLFGIDPTQYQQQQDMLQQQQAMQFAEMSPIQQAQYGFFRGGQQLGQGIGSLLGAQDPQLQAAGVAQKLAGQFDVTTVDGLKQYAKALQQAGADTNNVQLSNLSMMALDRAKQLEAAQYDIMSKQSKMRLEEAQAIKALREPDEGLKALIGKSTPESVAVYMKSRNPADLLLAKEPGGVEKLGEATIEKIGTATKQNKILSDTNTVLDNWLNRVTKGEVKFGLGETINTKVEGWTGNQSKNTLAQTSLKKFLETERNNILMAAKGTQTEGDAARAMDQIFNNTDWLSQQSVEQAIKDLKEYKSRQIDANNVYIDTLKGSSRKVGGDNTPPNQKQAPPETKNTNKTAPPGAEFEEGYKKYVAKYGNNSKSYEEYAKIMKSRQQTQ